VTVSPSRVDEKKELCFNSTLVLAYEEIRDTRRYHNPCVGNFDRRFAIPHFSRCARNHQLVRSSSDSSLWYTRYYATVFSFFMRPKLTAHAFTHRGTAYIGIQNNGKAAHSLEAALAVSNTSPLERLYWELPTGLSLVAERLPKWGRLKLPIAHWTEPPRLHVVGEEVQELSKKGGRWEIHTAETRSSEDAYALQPNKEYECGLFVYYMPAATETWTFRMTANDKGELHCSEPDQTEISPT
jgi:hypothetical protein